MERVTIVNYYVLNCLEKCCLANHHFQIGTLKWII